MAFVPNMLHTFKLLLHIAETMAMSAYRLSQSRCFKTRFSLLSSLLVMLTMPFVAATFSCVSLFGATPHQQRMNPWPLTVKDIMLVYVQSCLPANEGTTKDICH